MSEHVHSADIKVDEHDCAHVDAALDDRIVRHDNVEHDQPEAWDEDDASVTGDCQVDIDHTETTQVSRLRDDGERDAGLDGGRDWDRYGDRGDHVDGRPDRNGHTEGLNPNNLTHWSAIRSRLPKPIQPDRTSNPAGGALLPIAERKALLGKFCLRQWLQGLPVSAALAVDSIPQFASYKAANAIGTLLGKGVGGHGFDLRVRRGREFPACYENGWSVVQHLQPSDLHEVAMAAGFQDAADLADAIERLPRLA